MDPTLDLVLKIIPILIALLALPLWWRQQQKKCLAWEVMNTTRLVSPHAKQAGLKVIFNRRRLKDPHLSVLHICNNGSVPIKPDDFDEPFTMSFGDAQVRNHEVLSRRPVPNLHFTIPSSLSQLRIEPTLLNPGDAIAMSVLTDRAPTITCSGRLVGGTVRPLKTEAPTPLRVIIVVMLICFLFAAFWSVGIYGYRLFQKASEKSWGLAALFGALFGWSALIATPLYIADWKRWPVRWR
jgi:hypothetical protein